MNLEAIGAGWKRKWRGWPAQVAHGISKTTPVERVLDARYQRSMAAYRPALPVLTGLDQEICEGLQRDGVSATSLEVLGLAGSDHILGIARTLADDYAAAAHRRAARGEKFIMVPPITLLSHPRLFAWGVHERLLDIVETYLGLPPAYDGLALIYTVADEAEVSTRKWHRDREDRRMVKIAIYLNDVDKDGGPFELDTRGADARATADAAFVRSCEGKAGTVVFADTARCLHRGKPAKRDRSAIFYSYFSRRPRNPFFCERSGMSRAQIAALTADFTPRQAACVLWHDALPPFVRLIPSAPI